MIEDNAEFYEPEDKKLPPGTRCAKHPDRETVVACDDCGKAICDECSGLRGGGHAFCRECVNSSRLVDASPQILGAEAETPSPAAPAAKPAPAEGGERKGLREEPDLNVYMTLAVFAVVVSAAVIIWALFFRTGA